MFIFTNLTVMHRCLLLYTGLICYVMAFSQNYKPLVVEENSWNVLVVGLNVPFDTTYSTITCKIEGDTILDDITYKKMFASYDENPVYLNICGYLREDANRKVWYRQNEEEEYLMYDFSAEVGDSVLVGYSDPVYLFVDSITNHNVQGDLRPKYWLSCKEHPHYQETWIEGIGSSRGVIWSGSALIVGGWYRLLCMKQNAELIYMNPHYNSCYMLSTGMAEVEDLLVHIFPNPCSECLQIETNNPNAITAMAIMDLNGKVWKQLSSQTKSVDVSDLAAGVYLLSIHHINGVEYQKLIVE